MRAMTSEPLDYPNEPALRESSTTWGIAAFNRACYAIALLWIGAALLVNLRLSPIEKGGHEFHDFSQFYMGGLIARHHAWDALYPIAHAGSVNSPGEWEESDTRPAYRALADEAGVPEQSSRYIQPPPFALMLQPIAYLRYSLAKKAWNLLMVLCAWGVAVMAGKTYEAAARRRSPVAGGLALLVAVSPLTVETLRLMNVTPLIALLVGFSILGLLCRHNEGGAAALVLGAAAKYATAVLLPLYIAMRKWRAVIVMAVLTTAILAGSMGLMKTGPFGEFLHLSKTFGRVHTDSWNRSLPALLMHVANRHGDPKTPLHGAWLVASHVLQWGSLAALLAILFTRKREFWSEPSHVLAGAAALLCWFLIFSPILWDHYFLYLVPLWGWVAWEGRRSWLAAIVAAFVIFYPCLPEHVTEFHITRTITLAGPYECGMLATALAMLAMAAGRLLTPMARPHEDAQERRTTFTFSHAQFNRACAALAALWLLIAAPAVIKKSATWKLNRHLPQISRWGEVDKADFPQFYMGGVMARLRAWDSLYPIPDPRSHNNAGMPDDSAMRPRYAEAAETRGVGNRLRFIQPPPVALLLWPIGYLGYERAFQLWTLLLIACAWGVAVIAAKVFEILAGRPTRASGFILLLVALSPTVLHAIVIANMTLIVALCIGVTLLGLLRRQGALSGTAIVLGGITKYATLALLPLALVMRRWGAVAWSLLFAAILIGGSYALMRPEPFQTYSHQIAPTLSRIHSIETNQSLLGFLARVSKTGDVPKAARLAVLALEAVVLAALLWLLVRRPANDWDDPANVFAAATALLTFLLIFSPIFWEHYPVYLCPLWAWLIWEARRSWPFAILATLSIASMYVPLTFLYDWREPLNTHMLPGAIVMLGLSIWKLAQNRKIKPRAEAVGDAPGSSARGAAPGASAAPSASGLT
jgi:hypothetical protein